MNSAKLAFPLLLLSAGLLAAVVWQARWLRELRHANNPAASAGSTTRGLFSTASSSGSAVPNETYDAQARIPVAPITPRATNKPAFDWRQVESEDYRTYVKNLRDIGCPEQTIRDIVSADVRQAFAAQRAEVVAERFRDFKYWKSDTEEAAARTALETRQREVDETMRAAVRELLGADGATLPTHAEWQQAAWSQQLGFLPADKRDQTLALLSQSEEVDRQIQVLAGGRRIPENPEERLRILEAYERRKNELRNLLTPDEYELVEMTASWTANNLRRAMSKFEPTEEEFRVIFREWRHQDENLANIFAKGEPDPGKEHVFASIKNLLTPERYTLYRETWWK